MVRNLVGTLIEVGRGKVDADSIPSILWLETEMPLALPLLPTAYALNTLI